MTTCDLFNLFQSHRLQSAVRLSCIAAASITVELASDSSKLVAMEPIRRQIGLVSLAILCCFASACWLLGTWFRELPVAIPETSDCVSRFGSSVEQISTLRDSSRLPVISNEFSSSSDIQVVSIVRRSTGSLNSQEENEEIDVNAKDVSRGVSPLGHDDISDIEVLEKLKESLPQLYHSPRVFALTYGEMASRMRIFIYPSATKDSYDYAHPSGGEGTTTSNDEDELDLSSTADFFFRTLAKSENFITDNPEEAQLYLLPISIDSLWIELGPGKVGLQLRRHVQKVRDTYPYWSRSLGADHFYLSCHAYVEDLHRNFLELSKNAIKVACSPLGSKLQDFFPHKDFVFPHYRPVSVEDISSALGEKLERSSSTLAYVSDPLTTDSAASTIWIERWRADSAFDVESGPRLDPAATYKKLGRSRFCVLFSPHATLNIVDCLRFGCVPVLVVMGNSSVFHELPFQNILNWNEFSVLLDIKDAPDLKHLLTNIPEKQYWRMQYLGHQASKHMEWNTPPLAYDAFHMTLYELWLRRHTIRYSRRNSSH